MDRISVLIVDDHDVVRQGLHTYLEMQDDIQVVGDASNGIQAVERFREQQPDVVLMDLVMPEMDGVGAMQRILQAQPDAKIIVLSSFTQDEMVFAALEAGAIGYLLKDVKPAELAQAIRAAHKGEPQLHPDITRKVMRRAVSRSDETVDAAVASLTDREREVLRLLAQGMSNAELAQALTISLKTVKTHVSSILGKLELSDRTQAAVFAHKHGLDRA